MSPRDRLRYARVRTFAQVIQRRQTCLLTLLFTGRNASSSWFNAVFADLRWLSAVAPQLEELQAAEDWEWVRPLFSFRTQTLEAIRDALTRQSAVIVVQDPEVHVPCNTVEGAWLCSTCGVTRASRAALKAHVARAHGALRAARRKARTRYCPVCLRSFGSRYACLEHIHTKSEVCVINLLVFYPDLSEEKIEKANAAQK